MMHWMEADTSLDILQGDLTFQKTDAIVNAANVMLTHGGGLAGEITRRGGPVIDRESAEWVAKYGSVSHSNPAYTHAGNLPCKYIIHAVGPTWGDGKEKEKLGICTSASLRLAEKLDLTSIAFPAISTGIYGVPYYIAAEGMLEAILAYCHTQPAVKIKEIRVVLYSKQALDAFLDVFQNLTS